uniref:Lipocalin n=1 Tax=Rhipicephalus appendiculatus TaxID=34631 RepID=A0A131YHN7_RHIAP
MTWTGFHFALMLGFVHLLLSKSTEEKVDPAEPFEEDERYFCHQYAREAVNITGKIYVIVQNFNSSLPPLCDSAERVAEVNESTYIFTLAAVIPRVPKYLVKFNTTLVLSKTGKHEEENAMTYQYETTQPPKLRKLMYLSPNKSCMIFVDDRNKTDLARCQLLMPAKFANSTIPSDCRVVYDNNCPGENLTVYQPWCDGLPEITVETLLKLKNSTPPAQAC